MKTLWGEKTPYHSQRNNLESPNTACGVTSAINCLVSLGYSLPVGVGQAEDRLFRFLSADPDCRALYLSKPARAREANPIHEWQDIIALAVSRWIGRPIARFWEKAPTQAVLDHVLERGCCVVTGAFPGPGAKILSHSVALVGASCGDDGKAASVDGWTIKDPWGDHRTLYRDIRGNLIPLKPEEFTRILYAQDKDEKWCIFIDKP